MARKLFNLFFQAKLVVVAIRVIIQMTRAHLELRIALISTVVH